jgi:hypothetical protein
LPFGRSFTTVNPATVSNYRPAAGLPNQNSGRFVLGGILNDTRGVTFRPALSGPGGPGGLPELLIPNAATKVTVTRVSGVNPPFSMAQDPDFALCTEGRGDLSRPRACWRRKRLKDNLRGDYLLVDIAPPIIGQRYGLGDKDVQQLILAPRHQGVTLFPVNEWPAYVFVYRILDEGMLRQEIFEAHQIELIIWGIIYRSLQEASDCAESMREELTS